MPVTIRISVYTNSDDAFVAWAPSDFIEGCRGFMLERDTPTTNKTAKPVIVPNRVGFSRDKPKSGDSRPSNVWPFQRFNWTDHAVDVGNKVRYRVTAMIAGDKPGSLIAGVSSKWTSWVSLTSDAGDGFSCYFNRGLILSQFVARYLAKNKLTPAKFKAQLRTGVDAKFRDFLAGDLGVALFDLLQRGKSKNVALYPALYELADQKIEDAMIADKKSLSVILSNGSGKKEDGNAKSRVHLQQQGVEVIDRLLGTKGLGHNKFVVVTESGEPTTVWTGSTNWSTTGLCTQINNGLLIEDAKVAQLYSDQWDLLKSASPPATNPASFTADLVQSNDTPHSFKVGKDKVDTTVWFTPTSAGQDMKALSGLIEGATQSILFLMFTPGNDGLHTLAAKRANEKNMYVRGVVSTLGTSKEDNDKNVLDVQIVSSERNFTPDHYTVVQPQGIDSPLGPWIAEVTRKTFLSQIGHAIVHSKVLVIDALTDHPIVVTGSHNFSASASKKNDENLVIVEGNGELARAYSTYVMSVYQHYRYRSYIRETLAAGKTPWSYLDDDDQWLKVELKSKAQEIAYWTQG